MWISRLRVTGGFLADLDVSFGRGLNVVVGPRGAGKTTLLELLRHALGIEHADRTRAEQQAKVVRDLLGAGEVVLDVEDATGSYRVVVDAEGGGRRHEFTAVALMLGQNELENIASSAESRLRLIDLRARVREVLQSPHELGAATTELAALRGRLEELREEVRQRPLLERDLNLLRDEEARLLQAGTEELTAKRDRLTQVENELLATQGELFRVGSATDVAEGLRSSTAPLLDGLRNLARLELPPSVARALAGDLQVVAEALAGAGAGIERIRTELASSRQSLAQRELELRGSAEPLRAELDEAERGLGDITARIRNLQGQITRLERTEQELLKLEADYAEVAARRDAMLAASEAVAEQLFAARQAVAAEVSAQIGARVVIAVEHLADARMMRDVLVAGLVGSSLQYRPLAETLSRTVLPRQLLHLLESADVSGLASAAGIEEGRAARVVSHLQTPEFLSQLAQVALQDRVDFLLLDGATTKSVEVLSTGQKCAVTLPVVLTEHERTLILDQPEDHLDNAYLVSNIVGGLTRRSASGAQTIIATHNANIPVLGSAERVFSLRSDGLRGFIHASGPFDDVEIVNVITTLMEGGMEAFAARARFYDEHGQRA